MEDNIETRLNSIYGNLFPEFKLKIKTVTIEDNLTTPFIPMCGKTYEACQYKIAFVGRDDNNHDGGLKKFIESNNPLHYFIEFIDELEYVEYAKSYKSFWRFVINFLEEFYNENDLYKRLCTGDKSKIIEKISTSMAYGNVNSIAPFDFVKPLGASQTEWKKIKEASKVFDKAQYFLEVFRPDVMVVLHYQDDDNFNWGWFPNDGKLFKVVAENLSYYFLEEENYKTHIFWTKHPSTIGFDAKSLIPTILDKIAELNI